MNRKKNKSTPDDKHQNSDSDENRMMKQLDQFNSDQSWSELDELEQHLFNGSHEESSPQDMPKRIRKRDRRKQKEEEIAQYEQALKAIEGKNKIFLPAKSEVGLNLNTEEYVRMIKGVLDRDLDSQGVSRMLGLKSIEKLQKTNLYIQLQMIAKYLKDKSIPRAILEEHEDLSKGGISTTIENSSLLN